MESGTVLTQLELFDHSVQFIIILLEILHVLFHLENKVGQEAGATSLAFSLEIWEAHHSGDILELLEEFRLFLQGVMLLLYLVKSLPALVRLVKPLNLLLTSLKLGVHVLVFPLELLFLMVEALAVLLELL